MVSRRRCPEIMVEIYGAAICALVDSGAEVTCMSDELWVTLMEHTEEIPTFPVTGMRVSGAMGARSKGVRHQVLLATQMGPFNEELVAFIVPELKRRLIIGADFLDRVGAVLDFGTRRLHLHRDMDRGIDFAGVVYVRATTTIRVEQVECWEDEAQTTYTCVEVSTLLEEGTLTLHDPKVIVAACEKSCAVRVAHLEPAHTVEEKIREAVQAAETADDEQKQGLYEVLMRRRRVFSDRPGCIEAYTPVLQVNDPNAKGFIEKPYPVPLAHEAAVDQVMQQWLDWGIVRRQPTQFVSPLMVVPKKDGSIRACLDGRRLSRLLIPDPERPQPPEELMQRHYNARWLSTVDASMGYLHVKVREEDRKYLGFLYKGRSYVFCRLIYGTNVSGAHFIRAMDLVLGAEALSFTSIYVDDELLTAPTWELHLQRLDLLLGRHERHTVSIRLGKSKFCRRAVPFLGVILTPGGQSPDPQKTQAIREFPEPRNAKHLSSFFGVCNFYRRFTPHYAEYSGPMLPLLRKGAKWAWKAEQREAFDRLRNAFLDHVMLAYPIPGVGFLIRCDASDIAISAILSQFDPSDKEERVLSFMSRTLKSPEQNYSICERECLAAIFALQKWRGIILGSPITVETDNKSLSFLMRCRLTSARLARWAMYMQQFQLTIVHVAGKTNQVADTLSRYPPTTPGVPDRELSEGITIARVSPREGKPLCDLLRRLPTEQRKDPALAATAAILAGEAATPPTQRQELLAKRHLLFDGVLFRRNDEGTVWKAVVPEQLRQEVIVAAHEAIGHFGAKKVLALIKERLVWHGMDRQVRAVLAACDLCQRAKHPTVRLEGRQAHVLASQPRDLVVTDLYGPLPAGPGGVQYVLVLLDVCTKHVALYALRRATAAAMLRRVLNDYIPAHGRMKTILSDHGSQYTSRTWVKGLEAEGVKVIHSTIRHPQSNPAERVMRTLGQMFRTYCHDKHTRWPTMLPRIAEWINTTVHDSIGTTPYFLQHGDHPTRAWNRLLPCPPPEADHTELSREQLIQHALERARNKAAIRSAQHDAKGRATSYQEGDEVLLKQEHQSDAADKVIKKFFLLYDGPFKVVKSVAPNAYRLADPVSGKETGTYNVTNLRPYKRTTDRPHPVVAVVSQLGVMEWSPRRS